MRYWAYINNEVKGPFETEKLAAQAGFGPSSVVCPEDKAAGQNPGWKEASGYPDLLAALNPGAAPAPADVPPPLPAAAPKAEPAPAPRQEESPLMMTMRGTLLSDPVVDGQVLERFPAAAPSAVTPPRTSVPSPEPAPAAAPQDGQLLQKLDQLSAMLASVANGQSQALERLDRVEKAVLQMRSLLFPSAPPQK